ncbi:MAG: hypothetical protein ABJH98_12345 [Reichenbachiella sp.]|uniref:hypothetical protein n=1 Tax=Reichenbachiella sp. TaxID=2184521 RepID=UPI0032980FEE
MKTNKLSIASILYLFIPVFFFLSCDDSKDEPSIENNFLSKDFFYLNLDGKEGYFYGNKISLKFDNEDIPNNSLLRGGPNSFDEENSSNEFGPFFTLMLPIHDSLISEIKINAKYDIDPTIRVLDYSSDINDICKINLEASEINGKWNGISRESWEEQQNVDFNTQNFNKITKITLLDSSSTSLNVYQIEGEFQSHFNNEEITSTEVGTGKYRFQFEVDK